MILTAWLVEKLVLISIVILLHLLLKLLRNGPLQPILSTLSFVSLSDDVLMLILNVLDHKVFSLEDFLANFAAVSLVWNDLFAFILEEVLFVLVDELDFRVDELFRPIFDSFESLCNISAQEVNAATPFGA